MTQNPYAQIGNQGGYGSPGGFGGGGDFIEPLQSRTSILAVLSLIFSLICFIPGAGALGVIFGGAAVLFISTSGGRLRGMGLAITGIILGLLFSLLWIFLAVGASQAASFVGKEMIKPVDSTMAAIQAGDYKTARSMFTPTADKHITDEMLADFAKRYQAEVGNYKGAPKSMWEMLSTYGQVGEAMNSLNRGRQQAMPMPMYFDKTTAVVALEMDPMGGGPRPGGSGPNPGIQFPVINIGVLTNDGVEVWLVDPKDTDKLIPPWKPDPDMDDDVDPNANPGDGDAKSDAPTADPAPAKPDKP